MMHHDSFSLKIPGSTSNLGPGFDSIGLALNRYLSLDVASADEWKIELYQGETKLPEMPDNLVFQTAKRVSEGFKCDLPPLNILMHSDIPLARGLGSSGAAIIAGIEIADIVGELGLSAKQKAHIGSSIEGHPDNATASVYGGLTISLHTEEITETLTCPAPDIDLIAMIPGVELKTKMARSVLPKTFSYNEAVKASSIGNVLVAALLQKDWTLAGKMMEQDIFHQPYREHLVPNLSKVTAFGRKIGVYGTFLSGAGPTIICFIPKGMGKQLTNELSKKFPDYRYDTLSPVSRGALRLTDQAEENLLTGGF